MRRVRAGIEAPLRDLIRWGTLDVLSGVACESAAAAGAAAALGVRALSLVFRGGISPGLVDVYWP